MMNVELTLHDHILSLCVVFQTTISSLTGFFRSNLLIRELVFGLFVRNHFDYLSIDPYILIVVRVSFLA